MICALIRVKVTAAELIHSLSQEELARILLEYGEERFANRIARAIIKARPFSPRALAAVIEATVPYYEAGLHPATRTFPGSADHNQYRA